MEVFDRGKSKDSTQEFEVILLSRPVFATWKEENLDVIETADYILAVPIASFIGYNVTVWCWHSKYTL